MNMNPIQILMVEDDPADADLALRALAKRNLANSIEVVNDGEQALDFLFQRGRWEGRTDGPPRLILLDLKLPKVDGLEVLREIKGNPATRTIPVVVLTSSRQERDIVESYALGVNSYIQKPMDFEQFVDAVGKIGLYWLLLNEAPRP